MIKGNVRENLEFSKKIGVAAFSLVTVCPDLAGIKEIYPNTTLEKEPNYITEKTDDKGDYTIVNIVAYIKDTVTNIVNKINYMLTSKVRVSSEEKGSKLQWINDIGNTVWAKDEDILKAMATDTTLSDGYRKYIQAFLRRPYRPSLEGEADFYEFLQKFTRVDTYDPESILIYDTKKFIQGDFKELQKDLSDPIYADHIITSCYDIVSKRIDAHTDETTGEVVPESYNEYQGIYNHFISEDCTKFFQPEIKVLPKFVKDWVKQITGENGDKHYFAKKINDKYVIELARDYESSENPLNNPSSKHEGEPVGEDNGHIGKDDLPF